MNKVFFNQEEETPEEATEETPEEETEEGEGEAM